MRHAPIKQGNASQEHFRSLLGFGGSDTPEPNSPLTVAPAHRGRGPDRGSGARDRAHSDQHDDARVTDRVHEQQAQAHRRQERHPRAQEVDTHQVPEAQVGGHGHHSGGGGALTPPGAPHITPSPPGAPHVAPSTGNGCQAVASSLHCARRLCSYHWAQSLAWVTVTT